MNRNFIPILRWILTVPSVIAGFYTALLLGMASHNLATSFCPDDDLVSGMCMAAYMHSYEDLAMVLFPTIAAILVVWFPYLVAPKHKLIVVLTSYSLGTVIAVYLAFTVEGKLLLTLCSAVFFSGLVTLKLVRSDSKKLHQKSLN